eukprot:Tbor_TRINITY_DN4926_c0_g1::TRINITY_DN4926_c0_g1_i2::g.10016::m.10016
MMLVIGGDTGDNTVTLNRRCNTLQQNHAVNRYQYDSMDDDVISNDSEDGGDASSVVMDNAKRDVLGNIHTIEADRMHRRDSRHTQSTAISANSDIIFFGGVDPLGTMHNALNIFTLEHNGEKTRYHLNRPHRMEKHRTGKWKKEEVPPPKLLHTAVVKNNTMIVFGGLSSTVYSTPETSCSDCSISEHLPFPRNGSRSRPRGIVQNTPLMPIRDNCDTQDVMGKMSPLSPRRKVPVVIPAIIKLRGIDIEMLDTAPPANQ